MSGQPSTLETTEKRAVAVLFAAALLYGLAFIVPRQLLISPAEAQDISAALGVLFVAGLLGALRLRGLWDFCGLAWSREGARRMARGAAPFAPILVIPLINALGSWGAPLRPLAALAIALCGAVVEELLLRGLTLPLLVSLAPRHGFAAVLACAGLFAVLHLPNLLTQEAGYVLAQTLTAFFLGIALGLMRLCTGSVYPGIVAHILINATAAGPILSNSQQIWLMGIAAAAVGVWSCFWWKRLRSQA